MSEPESSSARRTSPAGTPAALPIASASRPGLGALPQFAAEQADQHALFVGCRRREEIVQLAAALGLGSAPGDRGHRGDAGIDLGDGERGRLGRRRQVAEAGVADAGLALQQLAGEVGGAGGEHPGLGRVGGEPAQAAGEQVYLGEAAGGGRHRGRGGREVREQHGPIIYPGSDRT